MLKTVSKFWFICLFYCSSKNYSCKYYKKKDINVKQIRTLEPFVLQRSALLFEFVATKFNINSHSTSMTSKMALPYISKIASNKCICSKDWWEVSIVGRYRIKTKSPQQWGVFLNLKNRLWVSFFLIFQEFDKNLIIFQVNRLQNWKIWIDSI